MGGYDVVDFAEGFIKAFLQKFLLNLSGDSKVRF